jgi:hypothetical protein
MSTSGSGYRVAKPERLPIIKQVWKMYKIKIHKGFALLPDSFYNSNYVIEKILEVIERYYHLKMAKSTTLSFTEVEVLSSKIQCTVQIE